MRLHLQVKKNKAVLSFILVPGFNPRQSRAGSQNQHEDSESANHHNDTRTTGAEFKVRGLESFRTADKIQTVPSAVVAS